MDAAERARFKALLLDLKRQLIAEGDVAIEPTQQDEVARPDADDDQPLSEMEQIIASRRNKVRTGDLKRIVAALQRLEDEPDDFGYCMECDDPIPTGRLEVMPYATLCVRCQSAHEAPRGGRRRHLRDIQ